MTTNLTVGKGLLYFGAPLVLAAVIAGSVVAVRAQVGSNPDAGLTDAQRDAKYRAGMATSTAIENRVAATFVAGALPVAGLPRAGLQIRYIPSVMDLDAATSASSEIVRGTVTGQRLEYCDGSDTGATCVISDVAVTAHIKNGNAANVVELSQPGSVYPTGVNTYGLAINEADPVPRIEDDILIFAGSRDARGYLHAIPYKVLTILQGKIEPNPLDKPLASLHGMPATTLLQTIGADLAARAGGAQ